MMKRFLKNITNLECALRYFDADEKEISKGNLTGDVSGLTGNVSGLLRGDVSGLTGNVERKMKTQYVFQAFDGRLYGEDRFDSPQVIGKINAELRRNMSLGRWVKASALTFEELKRRGNEYTARCLVRDGISSHQIVSDCISTVMFRADQAKLA
jgi:hypothetical protein